MATSIEGHLASMDRQVISGERDGAETVIVRAAREYPTDALDLWDAVVNPERLARWFLPIEGDLRVGGRYQLVGNAGGTIEECVEPERIRLTWEFAGGVSWVTVRFVPAGGSTRLELEHESHLYPGFTDRFGPGAVGVGWDLGFVGLARYLEDPSRDRPPEADPEWVSSPEALAAYRASSAAWGQADILNGTPPEAAVAAAEETRRFYSGEATPAEMGQDGAGG